MARPVILRFVGDTRSLDKAFKQLDAESQSFGRKMGAVAKKADALAAVGTRMTHWVTIPIIAAGAASVKMATDYQTAMAQVRALTNASSADVAKWSSQLLTMAPQLGIGPVQLAKSLYYVASAGISSGNAINVLTMASKASRAGLGDTSTIVDAMTSALNSYGEKNLSAAQATDVLVATVREGKMTAADLAGNLGKVIAPAQILGVKFNEVGAALASMTHVGLDTFTATTALRQIFMSLEKPSAGAQKAFKAMGTSAAALRTEIRDKGLLATLQDMAQRGHYSAAAFAAMIPNVRGLTGFMAMMKQSTSQTADIFGRMTNVTGATDKAFAAVSQTAGQKFAQALAGLQSAAISVGNILLPFATNLAGAIAHLASGFAQLSPQTQTTAIHLLALAAATGPALFIIGKLTKAFTTLARHPLITMIALLAEGFIYLWTTNEQFRTSVQNILKNLSDFANALKSNKLVVDSLSVAMILLGTKATVSAGMAVAAWIRAGAAAVASAAETIALQAMYTAEFLSTTATMVGAGIAAAATTAAAWASSIAETMALRAMYVAEWVGAQAAMAAAAVIAAAASAAAWIAANAAMIVSSGGILLAIGALVVAGLWLKNNWSQVWNGIKSVTTTVVDWIKSHLLLINLALFGPLGFALTWIEQHWSQVWAAMKTAFAVWWAIVGPIFTTIKNYVVDTFRIIKDLVTGHWSKLWTDIKILLMNAIVGITKWVSTLNTWAIKALEQAGKWLLQGLINGVKAMAGWAIQQVKNVGSDIVNGFKSLLGIHSPSVVFHDVGANMMIGLTNGINANGAYAIRAATNVAKQIAYEARQASQTLMGVWTQADAVNKKLMGIDARQAGQTVQVPGVGGVPMPTIKIPSYGIPSGTSGSNYNPSGGGGSSKKKHAAALTKAQKALAAAQARAGAPLLGLAHLLGQGLAGTLQATTGPVTAIANKLADLIQKQFANKGGKVPTAAAAAIAQMKALAAQASTFHKSFFSGLENSSDFIKQFSKGGSSGDVKAFLTKQVGDMKKLGVDLALLSKAGMPPRMLQELAAGGLDMLPLIDNLAHSSAGDLKSIFALQSQVDSMAQSVSAGAEVSLFGGGLAGKTVKGSTPIGTTKTGAGGINITVQATTGADPAKIAQEIAWQLKTMGY